MTTYTRLYTAPAVSQTALDTFLQSDADPLAKVAAAALYDEPSPARPGEQGFGKVSNFGGFEIISNKQARREQRG